MKGIVIFDFEHTQITPIRSENKRKAFQTLILTLEPAGKRASEGDSMGVYTSQILKLTNLKPWCVAEAVFTIPMPTPVTYMGVRKNKDQVFLRLRLGSAVIF